MPPPVAVVCAVIEDADGRVLMAQRPAGKHLALKWEFPGGKVESGEAPEAALRREITEELGATVVVKRPLPRFTYDYESVTIEMIPFICSLAAESATPHPHEHAAIQWVTVPEIDKMDLAPADWPVVAMYRERWMHR